MNMKRDESEEKIFQHDFFDTSGMADFTFKGVGPPPKGYPKGKRDTYRGASLAAPFDKRRKAFIKHCLANPAGSNIKGYYYELIRLSQNKGPVYTELIEGALRYIDERYDCADFVMLGIVRMLYQLRESTLLPQKLLKKAEKTLLDFKYWPDEPGIDSMCYWTENHVIMFSANEYLAGQLYFDRVFSNSNMTGREKMARARERILKWLTLRYQTGFSEWLSHIYYDEDITALINLVDFANDPLIVRGAEIVLDLLFFDMAMNSFRGTFGCTHGRSYAEEKRDGTIESVTDTQKLMFGMGVFAGADNMGAVFLALSERYRLPRVIYEIANETDRGEMINRQRMGIKIKEARRWGLDYTDFQSGMHFLTLEAYTHPRTVMLTLKMFDAFRWWENQFFKPFKMFRWLIEPLRHLRLMPLLCRLLEKDLCRNTREEVTIYTYKTPDYLISSAQDYRRGYGGDQQHIWQATMSPTAVVFTTHPGHEENTSGGYWVGSGTLPRVAQIKNLVIACYNASRMPGLYMTNKLFFSHAWFPRDAFDEVIEKDGWIFGRKEDGYIALYSQNGYRWQTEGPDAGSEIICDSRKNIWISELGRNETDGEFLDFIEKISSAKIRFSRMKVRYHSLTLGRVEFGWRGPLTQNGKRVLLSGYPRYENPYTEAKFPPEEILIRLGKHSLRLNLEKGIREVSDFVL
jgi:hypothetical protein